MATFDSAVAAQYRDQISFYNDKAQNGTLTTADAAAAKIIVGNYYNYLSSTGVDYGAAGAAVSQNQLGFGQIANTLLADGIKASNPNYDAADIGLTRDKVMIGLALSDADLRADLPTGSSGFIPYDNIDTYHLQVFKEYSIDSSYWGGILFDKFDLTGSYMGFSGYNSSFSNGDYVLTSYNILEAIIAQKNSGDVNASDAGIHLYNALTELSESTLDSHFSSLLQSLKSIFSDAPATPTNAFTISNSAGNASQSLTTGLNDNYLHGLAIDGGTWAVNMPGSVLNSNGMFNVAQSYMITDGWRPGNAQLSDYNVPGAVGTVSPVFGPSADFYYDPSVAEFDAFANASIARLQNLINDSRTQLNIDPLVLDLDGNGITLTNYQASNVLFNMDNSVTVVKYAA